MYAQLRKLSQYCQYGNSLDFMLRDHLVCGTNHDQTHETLLIEEGNLSLRKPMDISLCLESAIKKLKTEQKTDLRNNTAMCFRCDNLHNPNS